MNTHTRTDAGFTLLEIVIVIAVLTILATALTPTLIQRIVDSRVEATRLEEQKLYEGIVGHPDEQGTYGFAGDMGRLPTSVSELVRASGMLLYNNRTTVQSVGMGWNGPYANFGVGPGAMVNDPFGHPYVVTPGGQIRSAGPDGIQDDADDLLFPPAPVIVTGRVQVTVKTKVDEKVLTDPSGVQVQLFFSSNGQEASLVAATPPFIFDNVPMGLHAILVVGQPFGTTATAPATAIAPATVLAQQTVATPGAGRTKLIEIWY